MHIIYISFDRKFLSEFDDVNLKVIQGHFGGQNRSFRGQKSELWPNAHNMHDIRSEI